MLSAFQSAAIIAPFQNASFDLYGFDLFTEFWPPEMQRDFRQGISGGWRGGVFHRAIPDGRTEFKAMFGAEAPARQAAELLANCMEVRVVPPVGAIWWAVYWEMPVCQGQPLLSPDGTATTCLECGVTIPLTAIKASLGTRAGLAFRAWLIRKGWVKGPLVKP